MIKLVACRERTWLDAKTDYRQWDNLARAFGVELQMIDELIAIDSAGVLIVVDERGEQELANFVHPVTCTYLFGRTGLNNIPALIDCDASVRIASKYISLFGISAASIILHDRRMKNGHAHR